MKTYFLDTNRVRPCMRAATPANTGRLPSVVLMLGSYRSSAGRRRWADIKATLVRCPVFAGFTVKLAGNTASAQHCLFLLNIVTSLTLSG